MARHTTEFQSIRSEGGLLPADLLRRVLDPKEKLAGTRPEDYGLPQSERLNEVITQSWSRLRKHWAEFRAAAANLPAGEAGTGLTNDKWSLPLLRELGFGLLPTSPGPEINGRIYAINRFFGPVPIHLVGCGLSLDRRAAGVRGAAAVNPHGLVQEFLNRSSGHRWAIVSNGLRLRLLRDNQALSRQSFLEFDLEAMFVGEVYSDFVLLWLTAHATRFAPREDDPAKACWLEQWTKLANEQGTRALGELRGGVERALQILGEGFTGHQKNAALRDALRTGQVPLADFHGQLLRVVYRLIFLFVAEGRTIDGRSLLHPREDSDAAQLARERYAAHYSTARLRDMAAQIKGSRHADLWRQFHLLTGALSGQASFAVAREHLALPSLGSFLWDPASTATLNDAELTNHDFLEALRNLAFTRQGKALRPVDYKNLGAEELGGVYESLLALTPQISGDGRRFSFAEFAGNERKTSGSYYTSDSLVQCLLDSALDPVVEEAIKGKAGVEAEKAVLTLKICDPAVGSGHFLVGAAHRLARHLARVRGLALGESEPSPLLYQHALRDVIGRCVYGVDVNPMAAELCRVSLWLEALEPGKPLSFLDHHIRVGNSLLGATPELIAGGIPDEAFTAIEGDDKKACAVLKKRNKAQRARPGPLLAQQYTESQARLEQAAAALEDLPDDRPEAIRVKELAFRRHEQTEEYRQKKELADAWCVAFVVRKLFDEPGRDSSARGITQGHINDLADGRPLSAELATEVDRLSRQYQFLHWHLAFPEVFAKGGFDCVLGNPPWDVFQPEEEKFFSVAEPSVISGKTASERKRRIKQLEVESPDIWQRWNDYADLILRSRSFMGASGRFPLTSYGKTNLYSSFAEASLSLVCPLGRTGIVVPTGIATDEPNKHFMQALFSGNRLVSLFDFENKQVFPAVDSRFKFCLLTMAGVQSASRQATFAFFVHSVEELKEPDRLFRLSAEDVALLNPNTKTCPVFRGARDAELTKTIYRRVPSFQIEGRDDGDPWSLQLARLFMMDSDSDYFVSAEAASDGRQFCRLYESKLMHQFDHRFATFKGVGAEGQRGGQAEEVSDRSPTNLVVSRFYVPIPATNLRYQRAGWSAQWALSLRDITNVTNERTTITCVIPRDAAANNLPLILSPRTTTEVACLCSNLNSFVLDYVSRQKVGGTHINLYLLQQFPILAPSFYGQTSSWSSEFHTLGEWLLPHVLELVYTAWDLEPFAKDCGWSGPPFRWNEDRRFLLRCELDAAFFHLYLPSEANGEWRPAEADSPEDLARLKASFPTPRDAVAYIMETFPIIKRKDEEKWSEYRTKRVILEIYDAIAESIRTKRPYQTRLDPPPADPRCCHPPRDKVVAF